MLFNRDVFELLAFEKKIVYLNQKLSINLFRGVDYNIDLKTMESKFLKYFKQFLFKDKFYLIATFLRYKPMKKNRVSEPITQKIYYQLNC